MLTVKNVDKNSIADELAIKHGDKLIQINGKNVEDILDYLYLEGEESFELLFSIDGNEQMFEIERDADENIGLSFVEEIKTRLCKNKCVFCFVDQMPKGMRDTLYCKDDDYRFSFISGNYITLTNDSDKDIDRIIRLHLSPIYVSVHATDEDIRLSLLKNPRSTKIMEQLRKLTNNGIVVHTQVVMCPNLNDGEILRKTIKDLYSLYPMVKSLAVVPVGLTKFRDKLPKISPITKEKAIETIKIVEEFAKICKNKNNESFVYCSDEFYCVAEKEMPNSDSYDGYPQIENGVGLVRKFTDEFYESVKKNIKFSNEKTLLITGVSFYPYLKKMLESIDCPHDLICVKNNFFGESVTVAGLLTGRDIVNAVGDKKYDRILLPQNVLREFNDVFLDDMKLIDFEKILKTKAVISNNDGGELYRLL